MPTDDDKQIASEIEDALCALGIARRRRHGEDRPVAPFVHELRGGKGKRTVDEGEAATEKADHAR